MLYSKQGDLGWLHCFNHISKYKSIHTNPFSKWKISFYCAPHSHPVHIFFLSIICFIVVAVDFFLFASAFRYFIFIFIQFASYLRFSAPLIPSFYLAKCTSLSIHIMNELYRLMYSYTLYSSTFLCLYDTRRKFGVCWVRLISVPDIQLKPTLVIF